MKTFKNNIIVKLITSICIFLLFLNCFFAINVHAKEEDTEEQIWGGVLLNPIIKLLSACGDTVMEILHESIQEQDLAIIKVDGSQEWWERVAGILAVVAGIILGIIIMAVICFTGGVASAGFAALAGTSIKAAFVARSYKNGRRSFSRRSYRRDYRRSCYKRSDDSKRYIFTLFFYYC